MPPEPPSRSDRTWGERIRLWSVFGGAAVPWWSRLATLLLFIAGAAVLRVFRNPLDKPPYALIVVRLACGLVASRRSWFRPVGWIATAIIVFVHVLAVYVCIALG